jgi:TonB family protein
MRFNRAIVFVALFFASLCVAHGTMAQQASENPDVSILSETRGYDFGTYVTGALNAIRTKWYSSMPEVARLGTKGRVSVGISISRDGAVRDAWLAETSGSDSLDQAALAAVQASNPLRALPADFTGDRLVLRVRFSYNLK